MAGKSTTEKSGMDAKPYFLKYVGNLRNGVQLEAFGNREVLPGEIIPVRGPQGVPYASAFNLVREQAFIWCDEEGIQIAEPPEPKDSEKAGLIAIDSDEVSGDANRAFPM